MVHEGSYRRRSFYPTLSAKAPGAACAIRGPTRFAAIPAFQQEGTGAEIGLDSSTGCGLVGCRPRVLAAFAHALHVRRKPVLPINDSFDNQRVSVLLFALQQFLKSYRRRHWQASDVAINFGECRIIRAGNT